MINVLCRFILPILIFCFQTKAETQYLQRNELTKVPFCHAQLARIVLLASSLHLATKKKQSNDDQKTKYAVQAMSIDLCYIKFSSCQLY